MEHVLKGAFAALYCSRSKILDLVNREKTLETSGRTKDIYRGLIVKLSDVPGGPGVLASIESVEADNGGRIMVALQRPQGQGLIRVPVSRLHDDQEISHRSVTNSSHAWDPMCA